MKFIPKFLIFLKFCTLEATVAGTEKFLVLLYGTGAGMFIMFSLFLLWHAHAVD